MLCITSLLLLTGCVAAYTPPPLPLQHPAHPEATVAPALPPSTTLAYGPADIPTPAPASSMAPHATPHGMQHGMQGAHPSAQQRQPSVVGEGHVVAVVPERSQIVVDQKAIPGVMGAMTMGYRVAPPALLAGVKAGETIRFTMDPQQQVIVTLEKLHQ